MRDNEDRRERDIYDNVVVPPDGSGFEDPEFDGTALLDTVLGLDSPDWFDTWPEEDDELDDE